MPETIAAAPPLTRLSEDEALLRDAVRAFAAAVRLGSALV